MSKQREEYDKVDPLLQTSTHLDANLLKDSNGFTVSQLVDKTRNQQPAWLPSIVRGNSHNTFNLEKHKKKFPYVKPRYLDDNRFTFGTSELLNYEDQH
jgi:hypothetical protein